jgi:hypothetical protein
MVEGMHGHEHCLLPDLSASNSALPMATNHLPEIRIAVAVKTDKPVVPDIRR